MGQINCGRKATSEEAVSEEKASSEDSFINILTDDVLLVIFSYLVSLNDRANVARTCKEWSRVIKEPILWQTMDFWRGSGWEEGKEDYISGRFCDTNQLYFAARFHKHRWCVPSFPLNANMVLNVLQTFSNNSLKTVYLHVINLEILQYLTRNCPNLTTLSFLNIKSTFMRLKLLKGILDIPTFLDDDYKFMRRPTANFDLKFSFPASLIKLQIAFQCHKPDHGIPDKRKFYYRPFDARRSIYFTWPILNDIVRCHNLLHLTLAYCRLDERKQVDILIIGLPNLEELKLFAIFNPLAHDLRELSEYMFGLIARSLHCLKSLTFVPHEDQYFVDKFPSPGFDSFIDEMPPNLLYNIDESLTELSLRKNLTKLYITYAEFTPSAFEVLASGLGGLEELFLAACDYDTDAILQIIVRDLIQLKSLGVEVCKNMFSSFKALEHHPSIKTVDFCSYTRGIWVSQQFRDVPERVMTFTGWFDQDLVNNIFDTLMTLPNLEEVRGLGCIHMRTEHLEQLFAANPHIKAPCFH